MTDNITRIPTARRSHIAVHKSGQGFAVMLVTPMIGGRAMKSKLVTAPDRQSAQAEAKRIAEGMQLPVKGGCDD